MDTDHVLDVMEKVKASRPFEDEERKSSLRQILRKLNNLPSEVHLDGGCYDRLHNFKDTSGQCVSVKEARGCRYRRKDSYIGSEVIKGL